MKNVLIKILVIAILGLFLPLLYNRVEANTDFNPNDYMGNKKIGVTPVDEIKPIGEVIIGMIRGVGVITSVATLIVLGIKYMIGSVEERAQYKNTMVPYIIGAFMVFAITFFISAVIEIAQSAV